MDGFLACCLVKRLRIVSQRKKVMHNCGMGLYQASRTYKVHFVPRFSSIASKIQAPI